MPQPCCDMFGTGVLWRANLDLILKFLRELGYTTTTARLKTNEFGLPQRRVRMYFFCVKGSEISTEEQSASILATLTALKKDLTFEKNVLDIMEKIVPYLPGHALWLLGEPGVGKTPLGRIIAMMFSRYHAGTGAFRSASDFDFFQGVFFDKTRPALYDDGKLALTSSKRKKPSVTLVTKRLS
eukprot:Skav206027  [mRNA]  locus=scaffold1314:142714:143262:+ [translate_table: standard]